MREIETPDAREALSLPATVSLTTTGAFFGLGPDAIRTAIADGSFPVPILVIGGRRRVTRASLLRALGLVDRELSEDAPRPSEVDAADASVATVESVASCGGTEPSPPVDHTSSAATQIRMPR
jgi:hypothetical protein